jgi:hypothetical protein
MQYETCRHIKEDGAYCGSPALHHRKYCHYHLEHRGRRLRRARALRDNIPYRLEIGSLDSPSAIRFAIAEIVQALGSGQLDHRSAGKMLYGIQMANSLNRREAEAQAKAAAENQPETGAPHKPGFGLCGSSCHNDENSGVQIVQEYPQFEQEFGLTPGTDIDAEIAWAEHKANEQIELRQANVLPPPPGVHLTRAQFRVYREEAYQVLNMQINRMRGELREHYEMKRKQAEKEIAEFKKEARAATDSPEPIATSA